MLAARGGHVAALEQLLTHGSSRTQRNSERATAVHLLAAVPDGSAAASCLRLLVAQQPPAIIEAFSSRDERGRNAAHLAAAARSAPLLRELTNSLGSSILVEEDSLGESALDVLARAAAPSLAALRTPLQQVLPPSTGDEPLRALLEELERALSPADARTHSRRLARVPRDDFPAAAAATTAPESSPPPAPAAAPTIWSAPVAVGPDRGGGKLPANVDLWDDEAVAEDDTYEYVADDAAAAAGVPASSDVLGAELRRRVSGSEAGAGALALPPPLPPPGHPSLLSAHQRSSSLGIDDASVPGAVVLPPDALGLSRQR